MVQIEDGKGTGTFGCVNGNNELCTFAVTETEAQAANLEGAGYNINTGQIALTSDADHAILYFKNNENSDFVITAIATGINTAGTSSDSAWVTVVRNPTAGDIITDASNVDMNQNRNFGSQKTLSNSNAYKGKNGGTMTGGNDLALFVSGEGGRLYANIDMEIPKGSAIGIKIDPNYSSGTITVYAAVIGYLKNENR